MHGQNKINCVHTGTHFLTYKGCPLRSCNLPREAVKGVCIIWYEVEKFSCLHMCGVVIDFRNIKNMYILYIHHCILRHIGIHPLPLVVKHLNISMPTLTSYFLLIYLNINPNQIDFIGKTDCMTEKSCYLPISMATSGWYW